MIPISILFDAYINMNILLIIVFVLWCLTFFIYNCMGISHSYTTQLKLLKSVIIAIAFSPILVVGLRSVSNFVDLPAGFFVNFSDVVVAQYLNGGFEMQPAELESFLGLRERVASDFLSVGSFAAFVVAGAALFGAAIFTVRLIISIFQLRAIIDKSFAWRRFGNVHLRLSDTIHVPFSTRSVFRRYIVVPSAMMAETDDLKIALGHELQHLRQRDVEWEIALEFMRPLFFWNPAFYLWKAQIEQLRELSCDQEVLARGRYSIPDYCECLLRVCSHSLRQRKMFSVSLPKVALVQLDEALFGTNSAVFLRRRLMSVIERKSKRHSGLIFGLLAVPLFSMIILSSVAMQKPKDWSHDRLMLSTIINLERLERRSAIAPFN